MEEFFHAPERQRRREFLTRMVALLGIGTTSLGRALAELERDFVWARLRTVTGDWFTDMKGQGLPDSSDLNLLAQVKKRTNLEVKEAETVIDATKEQLEKNPLLYLTTHQKFTLPARADEEMGKVLRRGAFLFLDDCAGLEGRGFDASARALVKSMFPDNDLEPLPMKHPLFHCFFDIDKIEGGDKLVKPYMEGVTLDGRTPVVLCSNDLGCAWEGHPCGPGGEEQRLHAFKLGINLIFYALTF